MEEVDQIIVRQLREAGCAIDDEKARLSELDANEVILCAVHCLRSIDATDAELETVSASNLNMATKYKVASHLAAKCKQLGFKGDIGYQSFLYGAETEVRRLFLFLIEKLPKDEEAAAPVARKLDIVSRLRRKHVSLTWMPPMVDEQLVAARRSDFYGSKSVANALNAKSIVMNKMAPSRVNYYDNYASAPLDVGSLLSWNSVQLRQADVRSRAPVTFEVAPRVEHGEAVHKVNVEVQQSANDSSVAGDMMSHEERMAKAITELQQELDALSVKEDETKRRCEQLGDQVALLEAEGELNLCDCRNKTSIFLLSSQLKPRKRSCSRCGRVTRLFKSCERRPRKANRTSRQCKNSGARWKSTSSRKSCPSLSESTRATTYAVKRVDSWMKSKKNWPSSKF